MSIPPQFPEWLRQLANDGRGGTNAEMPSISRGRAYFATVSLGEHPTLGDYTSGSFAMVARLSPDAQGDPVATFTCTIGTPSGGLTPVVISLPVAAQSDLPAGDPETGLAEILYELTYTLSGVTYPPILGGRMLVAGAI
jgi:hypothetical protein